jgi:hypothetical protein
VVPHRASVILALGILGWLFCPICGIVAWVMANEDLRQMDAGAMDPAGRDLTQVGRLLGMIQVLIFAAAAAVILVVIVAGAVAGTS